MCLMPNVWKQEFCQEIILPMDQTQCLRSWNRQKNFWGQSPGSESIRNSTKRKVCEPVTKRGQYLGEHSTSDATADVCLELTLRTSAGNWFTAGRSPRGATRTAEELQVTWCRRSAVLFPHPSLFSWPWRWTNARCSRRQTFDVTTGRGWELLWMRLERPGRSGGALQTQAHPRAKRGAGR